MSAVLADLAARAQFPTHRQFQSADTAWHAAAELLDWPIMLSVAPDAGESVDRSNWRVILADMGERFADSQGSPEYDEDGRYIGGDWYVAKINHFLCKLDQILARPGSPAFAAMADWAARLERYPVASDDDLSDLESDEAPKCNRCGDVLCQASGEYDYDATRCEGCERIERRANATYGPAVTWQTRHDRRYHRAALRHYRGMRLLMDRDVITQRPIMPFGRPAA